MHVKCVKFEKNGLYAYTWDGDKRDYVRSRVKKDRVLRYLRETCEIAEGMTLKEFMGVVGQYKSLMAVISEYSMCYHLEQFNMQAQEPMRSPEEDDSNDIQYLEIRWHVETEFTQEKVKHPSGMRERIITADFQLSPDFHGMGYIKK